MQPLDCDNCILIMFYIQHRLRDIERSSKELDSRAAIDRETLEALQSDLVAEKLNTQHLSTVLEKFGVNVNMLLSLPTETIIETYVVHT